jgi:hypothetical protein
MLLQNTLEVTDPVSFEGVAKLKYYETALKIKIGFMKKKLRADLTQRMLRVIRYRIFYFPVCYPKIYIKLHRTIHLPVVLYRCETSPFALREEHKLGVLENRVLQNLLIFTPPGC